MLTSQDNAQYGTDLDFRLPQLLERYAIYQAISRSCGDDESFFCASHTGRAVGCF